MKGKYAMQRELRRESHVGASVVLLKSLGLLKTVIN